MSSRTHVAVIGGGLAGHSAAEALRKEGFEGDLTIFEAGPVLPYDRTLLSKAVLQGKRGADSVAFRTQQQYDDLRINLELGDRVTAVDLHSRELSTDRGRRIGYDQLLIATGAYPIPLPMPGVDLPGVHYLRTVADVLAIEQDLGTAESVGVIGSGFIGSEVAASLRSLNKDVSLIDRLAAPMAGALGPVVGEFFAEIHRDHGVALHMHSQVVALRGHRHVEEIVLADGTTIPCEMVVVGIGVRPATALFEGTDLTIVQGIRVSDSCESNVPGVFAAGDVANWWHPGIGAYLRVEHFNNAAEQGTAAAKAMLGQPVSYSPTPYFWSDQYDTSFQYVGHAGPEAEVILRRYPDGRSVTAFYLEHDRLVAVAAINRGKDIRPSRRLLEARTAVDRDVLADADRALRDLAG